VKALEGKVALVAGATRGAGRGIAIELGAAGATVYCSGRSSRGQPSDLNRPETIEETAELVTKAGGNGIARRVDHSQEQEVKSLIENIKQNHGRLDILVNDIWGGEKLSEWGKKFWELDLSKGIKLLERAIFTHLITSRHAVPLMLERDSGLIVEITDGDTLNYRGNLVYDLAKTSVIRLASSMAEELKDTGLTALSLTPGFLRSEEMLEHFGVTADNWLEGAKKDPYFAYSETPHYIGRAVVALATDPAIKAKSGQMLSTWKLSESYDFEDIDGRRPHWGRSYEAHKAKEVTNVP
jgi:NAD(P)-dependent dehydrogenase (short-subunit alcohol dehydrogenase family)